MPSAAAIGASLAVFVLELLARIADAGVPPAMP